MGFKCFFSKAILKMTCDFNNFGAIIPHVQIVFTSCPPCSFMLKNAKAINLF